MLILIEHLFRPPSQGQANSHKRKSIHRTDHKEPEKSKLRPPLTLYLMTDQSLVKRRRTLPDIYCWYMEPKVAELARKLKQQKIYGIFIFLLYNKLDSPSQQKSLKEKKT